MVVGVCGGMVVVMGGSEWWVMGVCWDVVGGGVDPFSRPYQLCTSIWDYIWDRIWDWCSRVLISTTPHTRRATCPPKACMGGVPSMPTKVLVQIRC